MRSRPWCLVVAFGALAGCAGTCSHAAGSDPASSTTTSPSPSTSPSTPLPASTTAAERRDVPRPIAPMSGAIVTTHRPTLRWSLPTGIEGATVEVCRDRACTRVEEVLEVRGSSARTTHDLLPGRWYWRVRTPASASGGELKSATWSFSTIPRTTPVDTSWLRGGDVNGDGYDDAIADAYLFFGGSVGLPKRPSELLPEYSPDDCVLRDDGMVDRCAKPPTPREGGPMPWGDLDAGAIVGDVNGDGFADVIVTAPGDDAEPALFFGAADGTSPVRARAPFARGEALGDVDGDGFGDVVASKDGTVTIAYGGPDGFDDARTTTLPGDGARAAGDVDADGLADLLVVHGEGASLHKGAQGGLSKEGAPVATDEGGVFVAGGDINGDGYCDVAVLRHTHNPYFKTAYDYRVDLRIFLGWRGGLGNVAHPQMARTWYGRKRAAPRETDVAVADVDGDGFADLVVGEVGLDGELLLLEGGPGGPSKAPTRVQEVDGKLWFGAPRALGDVDADGHDDVLVQSVDDILGHPHVWLYRGNRHGLPKAPTESWYFFPRIDAP